MSILRSSLLFGVLTGVTADTYTAVSANANCQQAVGCAGYYRQLTFTTSPANSDFGPPSNVTGFSLGAVGIQAAGNGVQGVAKVDVAGFKFKTPADLTDQNDRSLKFYFGYLGANGVWDNSTQTGSIVAAAAEIVSQITSLEVYYDRDGAAGFQWDLNAGFDIVDCTTGTYDCFDKAGSVKMTDLSWSFISHASASCASVAPTGNYDANCKIESVSTTGSLNGQAVVSITARTSSQPIIINGVTHNPDKAKWDLQVNYPWSNKTALINASVAKVALIAVHAGKAAAGVAVKAAPEAASVTFTAAGGKAAYFGYVPKATIDSTSTDITTQTITAAQITAFTCTGKPCGAVTLQAPFITGTADLTNKLKFLVTVLQGIAGWTPQLTFHSFVSAHPVQIDWDPEVGVSGGNTSGAEMALPGVFALMIALLLN